MTTAQQPIRVARTR